MKDGKKILGPLERVDGSYTNSMEESIELLLHVHFPADPSREQEETESYVIDSAMIDDIVTVENIKRALKIFGPYKAAGGDGIFPAMLQHGSELLVPQLVEVFKASLYLGYIPGVWRKTKVIFLPKPGKPSYQVTGAWRPISLTSFTLKLLERLIDWNLRSDILTKKLLDFGQYAYLKGVSTESALHQLVARIELALKNKQMALGIFLDIEGAFSHANFKAIKEALRRENVEPYLIKWIGRMLADRTVTAEIDNTKLCKEVQRGCPQGGVLSPLLWNLVILELLQKLHDLSSTYKQAYADDVGMLEIGMDAPTVRSLGQRALNATKEWCAKREHSINPEKIEVVLFTSNMNTKMKPLVLDGKSIPFKDTVRYLGVV